MAAADADSADAGDAFAEMAKINAIRLTPKVL